jgi:uncharacterized membrane protein SpoIIM required for sporulation
VACGVLIELSLTICLLLVGFALGWAIDKALLRYWMPSLLPNSRGCLWIEASAVIISSGLSCWWLGYLVRCGVGRFTKPVPMGLLMLATLALLTPLNLVKLLLAHY